MIDRALLTPWMTGSFAMRRVIADLDHRLSRRAHVRSYSDDPGCMLRVALTLAQTTLELRDGTVVRPGDPVLDVHCWNERVPKMPPGGADIAWARRTAARLQSSLRLLAQAMETDAVLRPARAVRARVNFVGLGGSNAAVSRIIARLGFEDVDEGSGSVQARVHDLFENLLIGALVWTHNPAALRRDKLIRERRPVWSSRERLLAIHRRDG